MLSLIIPKTFQYCRYTGSISVYALYVYLCFLHEKMKSISLSNKPFCPRGGAITPLETACSRESDLTQYGYA